MEEQKSSSVIVLVKSVLPNDTEKSNVTPYENVEQTSLTKEPLKFSPMIHGENIVAWNFVSPQD